MTLRDHRQQAKHWSYGRAQLSGAAAAAPWGKSRTRREKRRVQAVIREQQKRGSERDA